MKLVASFAADFTGREAVHKILGIPHSARRAFSEESFTVTVTHTGSTKKYSEGWETIFSGRKGSSKSATPKSAPKKKAARAKKAKR